jgi:hypothetical protein
MREILSDLMAGSMVGLVREPRPGLAVLGSRNWQLRVLAGNYVDWFGFRTARGRRSAEPIRPAGQ